MKERAAPSEGESKQESASSENNHSSDLRQGVDKWLRTLKPVLQSVQNFEWTGNDLSHFWHFLKRSAVQRQYEALETILQMSDAGHGHFGVTLLRPAYEEYIWIAFLNKHPNVANELIVLWSMRDVAHSLQVQNERLSVAQMADLGFTQEYLKQHAGRAKLIEPKLQALIDGLGWKRRKGKHNSLSFPSMSFLSKSVGHEAEYKFLYHATSRFVHFAPNELLRRVWGRHGRVSISSKPFSQYWTDFAIYWAFATFVLLLCESADVLEDFELSEDEMAGLIEWLRKVGAVPIITRGELDGWPVPPSVSR